MGKAREDQGQRQPRGHRQGQPDGIAQRRRTPAELAEEQAGAVRRRLAEKVQVQAGRQRAGRGGIVQRHRQGRDIGIRQHQLVDGGGQRRQRRIMRFGGARFLQRGPQSSHVFGMRMRGGMAMAGAQRQGQPLNFIGHFIHELVQAPHQFALRRRAQDLDIRIRRQHGLEGIEQGDQRVDALELDAVAAPREQIVARHLQPVGQVGMGIDQGAKGGGAGGVRVVDRGFGPEISRKGMHRLGQKQPAAAIIQDPAHQKGIDGVEQRAAHRQHQMIARVGRAGEGLTHGKDEGEHAAHGDRQRPAAVRRNQAAPQAGEEGRGNEGRRGKTRKG